MHSLYNCKILNIEKVQPLIYITTTTFNSLMNDYGEGEAQMDILNTDPLRNFIFIQKQLV